MGSGAGGTGSGFIDGVNSGGMTQSGGSTATMNGGGGSSSVGGSVGDGGSISQGGNSVEEPAGGDVQGHPDPNKMYPVYDGFSLYLVEEFDSPLDLNNDPIWTWNDGQVLDSITRFSEDGISFQDGKMMITLRDQPIGETPTRSGEFRTRSNAYRYGLYVVRYKPPNQEPVNGQFPNFLSTMFTYRTPGSQEWQEVDFELLGDQRNGVTTNVIMVDGGSVWSLDIEDAVRMFPSGPGAESLPGDFDHGDGEFHELMFEVLPEQIRWWVDGALIRVRTPNTLKTNGGSGEILFPDRSMKIMMNLWQSDSSWAGNVAATQYPLVAEYDWFRFYKWDGDDQYPCEPLPNCLSPEDVDENRNNAKDN